MAFVLLILLAWAAILTFIAIELGNEAKQWKRECVRLRIEIARMNPKDFEKVLDEPHGTE